MSLRDWAPTRKFFAHLERCDRELAEQMGSKGRCAHCGGKLHRADFPRKTSWLGGRLVQSWCRRVSFCCAERECRKRLTPPSFRFAQRKWYPLFVVVVAAALGPSGPEHVTGQVSVAGASPSVRSVRRWQRHYRREYPLSRAWLWLRAHVPRPPLPAELPQGLLARQRQTGVAATVGATIGLLVQAGLASMIEPFKASITIRRDWHCCDS